jgi:hypothetical protein
MKAKDNHYQPAKIKRKRRPKPEHVSPYNTNRYNTDFTD